MLPKGDYKHNNKSDHWATPRKLYKSIIELGYIDPCPLFSKEDNLMKFYVNHKLYINPPFSKIETWVNWAIEQYKNGCEILFLMPSRTDTKYFHRMLEYKPKIYFFKGRLSFNDCGIKAPFPCILIHLNHNNSNKNYDSLIV